MQSYVFLKEPVGYSWMNLFLEQFSGRWMNTTPPRRICGPWEQSSPSVATWSTSSLTHRLSFIGKEGGVPLMQANTAAASDGLSPASCSQVLRKGQAHLRFSKKPRSTTDKGRNLASPQVPSNIWQSVPAHETDRGCRHVLAISCNIFCRTLTSLK